MSKTTRLIVDAPRISRLVSVLEDLPAGRYEVLIKPYDKRNLDQNALSHVWYAQVAKETGEQTPDEVKRECKLRFGVPILRTEDPEFKALYDGYLKNRLSYEEKLKAMHYLPVTSLMNKDQMARYLDQMQAHYHKERGIYLDVVGG